MSIDHDAAAGAYERTLHEIVAGTAAETGERFFDELVRHLARAMGTRCAWVTEWLEEERRLRALSFWVGDGYYGDYEYDVSGTPCEPVVQERQLCHVPDRVIELFPDDPDLPALGAVSYMGVPLLDTDGMLLGHLALLHTEPLEADPTSEAVFRVFAGRAAAELRRLRRDRDLREREEKLTRLIDSAMDAIVELDADLAVVRVNAAAERLFGRDRAKLVGAPLVDHLAATSGGKLAYLARQLGGSPEGRQSLWIHDGLEALRGDDRVQAEATLSRFEMKGETFFTLILRDIADRLAAEERIRSLTEEATYLRAEIDSLRGFAEIVGESPALRRVLEAVQQVADTEASVLITGETGTGKELVARAIHRRSGRAEGPLITVNCAAIPASLQESEFFGHDRGAFTGATERRDGRFKLADGGTIFLDEVGELPADLQAKLLRVLQQGEFEPVGSSHTERVDVRVISATNRDLEAMVEAGTFRSDLLYRLDVFPIHVPPLRERGDDVVLLAEAFVDQVARRDGRVPPVLTDDGRARLRSYDWPGNVRELQNVIERAVIVSGAGNRLRLEGVLARSGRATPDPTGVAEAGEILTDAELRRLERDNMRRALEACDWKISGDGGAAERLDLNPNTLRSRMKAFGLRRPSPDS